MNRSDAPAALASLFADQGGSILLEGGRESWEEALAPLPDALFGIKGTSHPGVTVLTLARDLWNRGGDLKMATAATRGLMRYHVEQNGTESPDALVELGALGVLAQKAGRIDEGAHLLEQAWTGLRSVAGGRDLRLAVVAGNLGLHYARTDQLNEAEHLLDTALRIRKREAPETLANVAGQLGEVRLRIGKVEEGLENLRTSWLSTLDTLGEGHAKTLQKSMFLARALNQTQNYRESVPLWRDLHVVAKASGRVDRIASIGFSLGQALYRTHKKEEAIRLLDDALRHARGHADRTGEVYEDLPVWLNFRAQIELDLGRAPSAEGIHQEAVAAQIRLTGDSSPEVARRYATLGTLIGQLGRLDEAMGYLESAASLLLTELGPRHTWTLLAMEALVDILAVKIDKIGASDKRTARDLVRHALQTGGNVLGFDHPSMRRVQAMADKHHLS